MMAKYKDGIPYAGEEVIDSSAHRTPTFAEIAMEKAAAAHDIDGVRSLLS